MQTPELRSLLEQVQTGQMAIDVALARLAPAAELGFAHVDLHRRQRCGFPEVIFCEGKTCEWVGSVVAQLAAAGQDCLATRVSADQAEYLSEHFPAAQQDRLARTFWLPAGSARVAGGRVTVITAGTSDLPVAQEAVVTARALGSEVNLLADVGVAGIHRSVVGGLVDCPVVAVPTSVGYGAAFQGVAPLLTMLNSCSANVVVVNIDSGFKGGYVAALIARRRSQTS
jgi:NCAIR mutase (PurE)-related protein